MELKIPVTGYQFFVIVWSIVMISSGYCIIYEYQHKMLLFYQQYPDNLTADDSFTNVGLATSLIFGIGFIIGFQVFSEHYEGKFHIRMPRISVRFKND